MTNVGERSPFDLRSTAKYGKPRGTTRFGGVFPVLRILQKDVIDDGTSVLCVFQNGRQEKNQQREAPVGRREGQDG